MARVARSSISFEVFRFSSTAMRELGDSHLPTFSERNTPSTVSPWTPPLQPASFLRRLASWSLTSNAASVGARLCIAALAVSAPACAK